MIGARMKAFEIAVPHRVCATALPWLAPTARYLRRNNPPRLARLRHVNLSAGECRRLRRHGDSPRTIRKKPVLRRRLRLRKTGILRMGVAVPVARRNPLSARAGVGMMLGDLFFGFIFVFRQNFTSRCIKNQGEDVPCLARVFLVLILNRYLDLWARVVKRLENNFCLDTFSNNKKKTHFLVYGIIGIDKKPKITKRGKVSLL